MNLSKKLKRLTNKKIHIIIPARKGSKGLHFKNRKLLGYTLNTIPSNNIKNVIISTDDEYIITVCKKKNLKYIIRKNNTGSDSASMKSVISEYFKIIRPKHNDLIIVLYLTYPQRTWKEIEEAFVIFNKNKARSLLCRKEVKSHPYLCFVEDGFRGVSVIKHQLHRRQTYPKCFELCHYICMFTASELNMLGENLYNDSTIFCPIKDVIDIDTSDDLDKFLNKNILGKINIEVESNIIKTNQTNLIQNENIVVNEKFKWLNLVELKEYIRDKRIVIVPNSSDLLKHKLGKYIDDHDLVIRMNCYDIKRKHTGEKTDIHCCVWLQEYNIDKYVNLRVVFSGGKENWENYIKNKIIKDKQKYLLNIHWPMLENIIIKKDYPRGVPTTGFNIVKTLMHLGTYKELNLVGFTFYDNGKSDTYRMSGVTLTEFPISRVHNYKYEKDWIMTHKKEFDKKNNIIKL